MTVPTNKRFPGWNQARWEAEKERTGLTDEQLYDVCKTTALGAVRSQQSRNFFRSGKLGSPENYS